MPVAVAVSVDIEVTEADMFERSFIETGFNATNNRGRWAALASMALQAALVSVLILLPLMFTEALPRLFNVAELTPPAPPAPRGGGGRPVGERRRVPMNDVAADARIHEPREIPNSIERGGHEEAAPYTDMDTLGRSEGPLGPGVPDGVFSSTGTVPPVLVATTRPPMSPRPEEKRIAVSEGVLEGLLVHRVVPDYPVLARKAQIQGEVMLHAVISRDGTIEGLRMMSGHPLLAKAAVDAVQQWRYRPYMLNRQPVEVETEITVRFTLGH
jgi:protein TonB